MKKNTVIVLLSPSSAGKDSILNKLINQYNYFNFTNLVSHTTRKPRQGEINGKEYYFVTKEEFDKVDMIEIRSYNTLFNGTPQTWYYGLSQQELNTKLSDNKLPIVILDYKGLHEFQEYAKENNITVVPFYIQVNPIIRTIRCIKRGSFSWIEHIRRMIDDMIVFRGADKECIVVKNENKDINFAVIRILSILREKGIINNEK